MPVPTTRLREEIEEALRLVDASFESMLKQGPSASHLLMDIQTVGDTLKWVLGHDDSLFGKMLPSLRQIFKDHAHANRQ
jgi:hypothetical protein